MTARTPTLAQRVHLRILAECGGTAPTQELVDHPEFTSRAHLIALREDGFVKSYPTPGRQIHPHALTWELTDDGLEIIREEVRTWMHAEQTLDLGDLEAEA